MHFGFCMFLGVDVSMHVWVSGGGCMCVELVCKHA
jgi:hypothetical protein